MAERFESVLVIGDGSWGTALALLLATEGVRTRLWSAFPEQTESLKRDGENKRYLPGVRLLSPHEPDLPCRLDDQTSDTSREHSQDEYAPYPHL